MPGVTRSLQRLARIGKHVVRSFYHRSSRIFSEGCEIPILTYHQVGSETVSDFPSIYISKDDFEKHIEWLCENGYRFVSIDEVLKNISQKKKDENKRVVLTFDDGYEGVYQYAFPVLKRRQLTATIFLIPDKLGKIEKFSYLNVSQIQEMANYGFEIGSHSLTHQDLTLIEEADLKREIFDSKKRIEDLTSRPCSHFCYPYGKWNHEVQNKVREAGYKSASSSVFGRWNNVENLFALKRIGVGYRQTLPELWCQLEIISW